MIGLWGFLTCAYYLVNFLQKYQPGNIYENSLMGSFSGIVANGVSALVLQFLGIKWTLILSFLQAGLTSLAVAFLEKEPYAI